MARWPQAALRGIRTDQQGDPPDDRPARRARPAAGLGRALRAAGRRARAAVVGLGERAAALRHLPTRLPAPAAAGLGTGRTGARVDPAAGTATARGHPA